MKLTDKQKSKIRRDVDLSLGLTPPKNKIHKNKKELIFQKNELLEFYENYLQPSKHTPQLGFQTYLDMNVSLQSGLSSSLLQIKEMIFKGQMKIIEKKASYGEELRKLSNFNIFPLSSKNTKLFP